MTGARLMTMTTCCKACALNVFGISMQSFASLAELSIVGTHQLVGHLVELEIDLVPPVLDLFFLCRQRPIEIGISFPLAGRLCGSRMLLRRPRLPLSVLAFSRR